MQMLMERIDRWGRPRTFVLAQLLRLEHWRTLAEHPSRPSGPFSLMLVISAPPPSTDVVADFAEWCIQNECFSVAVWGVDADRVHDVFDEVDVQLALDREDDALLPAPVLMTTGHVDESLLDALDFYWEYAVMDEGRAYGAARVAVAVGEDSPSSAEAIRAWAARARGDKPHP